MDSDSSADGESGAKSWSKGRRKGSGDESGSSEDEDVQNHSRSSPKQPKSPPQSPPQSPSSPIRSPTGSSPRSHPRSPPRSSPHSPPQSSPQSSRSPRSPRSPPQSPPQSPLRSVPRSPPHSPPLSPARESRSRSNSVDARSRSVSPRRSRSNSPRLSRSTSPRPSRSPSRSISRSGSPRMRSRSGSPARQRSPSGSPRRSRSRSSAGSRSPRRRSFSGSRSALSPTGSVSRSPTSYPKREDRESKGKRNDGHRSDSNQSDDGRSNISSNSSFGMSNSGRASPGSQGGRSKKTNHCDVKASPEKGKFEPHNAGDLSDVSDLDSAHGDGSLDSLSDEEGESKKRNGVHAPEQEVQEEPARKEVVSLPDEMEQLDFEAEEPQPKEDREEGECEGARPTGSRLSSHDAKSEDDGELNADEVEEGEITDEDENRPEETEPRPICRFYNRGQCTWGSSCRFLHPGVTDKGNYTMFDMVRPLVPNNGPPMYGPMLDYRPPIERPMVAPVGPVYAPARKEETPLAESAWERGLRHAKEMLRKATKRKETDMDFEEKKMNLSLGQDELDKENDYYTRPASPALDDEPERWSGKDLVPESKHHRMGISERYDDLADPYYGSHHARDSDMWRRVHYEGEMRMGDYGRDRMAYDRRHPAHHPHAGSHRSHPLPADPGYYSDKYERKKKSHTVREVIVQRSHKYLKDEGVSSSHHGRGDEWSDPWMRSKSPGRKTGARTSRRQSYSSGSSYSSSSSRSSRSYSSSYSRSGSRSRSRSKSRSLSISRSRSRSPLQMLRRGKSPHHHKHQRSGRTAQPDGRAYKGVASEKRTERVMHMNPPAPSPRKQRPQSPSSMRKAAQNPPLPQNSRSVLRGTERKGKARRSRSSSGSESSGSSSDSSESSFSSSSSSSRHGSPPVRQKKIAMDERLLAQSTKIKAMDALKLSGQKQQIKLTLKTPGAAAAAPNDGDAIRRERTTSGGAQTGKKRPAESPPGPDAVKPAGAAKPAAKKPTSRREELLKQLKAVEEAIARKRSKIA